MTQSDKNNRNLAVDLFQAIRHHFDASEIRQLCFEINISYENLEGTTLSSKIVSLLQYSFRRNKLESLLAALSRARPNNSDFNYDSNTVNLLNEELGNDSASGELRKSATNIITTEQNISISGSTLKSDGPIIVGNENEIQNIFVTVQYFEQLIGNSSGELMSKIARTNDLWRPESAGRDQSTTVDEVLAKISRVLSMESHGQLNVISEIASWLAPIIDSNRQYRRRNEFPFGLFCGEMVAGLEQHHLIKLAFETESIPVNNKIPLNYLTALFPLPDFLKPTELSSRKGIPIYDQNLIESLDNTSSAKKDLPQFFLSTSDDGLKCEISTKFSEYPFMESWQMSYGPKKFVYQRVGGIAIQGNPKIVHEQVIDFNLFKAFMLGVTSDFARTIRRVVADDQDFELEMTRLFESVNLNWND